MLPIDRATLSGLDGLQLDALPVPYVGSPLQAVLYLLLLNPGLAPESERLHDAYSEQNRLGLTFRSRVPFWPLDPALAGVSGHTWWAQRFRRLADEVGWDTVRERVMCVQFFPYHSLTFSVPRVRPPSQTFSFGLVREAAREGGQGHRHRPGPKTLGSGRAGTRHRALRPRQSARRLHHTEERGGRPFRGARPSTEAGLTSDESLFGPMRWTFN